MRNNVFAFQNGSRSKDLHSRKMTLRFIFVTPRQLIEKEGKEIKQNRIPLYDKNMDLIGHKDDFRYFLRTRSLWLLANRAAGR